MNDLKERIKRRLPAGYAQLLGRDDDDSTDYPLRRPDGPPKRIGGGDGPPAKDTISRCKPGGSAAPKDVA